jgi:septal ring factor EnvC (AmiA/AmiB activator)
MYWYFLGGGATGISGGALTPSAVEQLSERVAVVVEDPTRTEAAQKSLAELKREIVAFEKQFAASSKAIKRSYSDHAEKRTEIDAVLDELNRDWERGQERALDLRFELREQLTREEWETLFSESNGRQQ